MKCALCRQRSGKRHCPGARGYICPPCCGKEREVSIECPFECVHLQEAHRYESQQQKSPQELPYASHEVSRQFVEENQGFVSFMADSLFQYAMREPGMVDADVRAALDALVRTYETLSSGLIYETLPQAPIQVSLYRELQRLVDEWRQAQSRRAGMTGLRDADVLRALVFLGRLAHVYGNGRPRGRAFLSFLRRSLPQAELRRASSIIIPGA